MSNVLVLRSSLSGTASVSNEILDALVRHLGSRPQTTVVERDLARQPVPHLLESTTAGVRAEPTSEAERATRALSDELLGELKAADLVVIGAPMYNFSMPSTLRTWFDHVLRPRVAFAYDGNGPRGLITGKRVIVVETRGGMYSEGAAQALDFQEPYLRQLLGFMGITDVHFVRAEKIAFGPEARDAAVAAAKAQGRALIDASLAAGEQIAA